jgi:filamentous hemagglutinin family protein
MVVLRQSEKDGKVSCMKYNYQYKPLTKQLSQLQNLLVSSLVIFVVTPVYAQITPDNTLSTENSLITPNVLINGASSNLINGGAQRGSNVFHSFRQFNVNNGQRVYFANPSGVVNILTRVTGASASNILGTLGVDGSANLFLMNPNGILFGKNSSLDVRGSFVGTTASGIQFGNQGIFSAVNPESPSLLTINPSAFLFNQINSGAINIQSQAPAGVNPNGDAVTGLRVPDGQSLLLVGGNLNLDGGRLRAYDGHVELASLKAPGTVGLNVAGNTFSLNIPNNIERGDISLQNQSAISVLGAKGGDVTLTARNLDMSNSFIAGGIGKELGNINTQSGDININATGAINLLQGSIINSGSFDNSKGNSGDINIVSNSLLLTGATLTSNSSGEGNSGNININTKDSVILEGLGESDIFTRILSGIDTQGVGKAGNIQITTGNLTLNNVGVISSSVFGRGNGGKITINVRDGVSITNDSSIFSDVDVEGVGNAGNIEITTGNFSIRNEAFISSSTIGKGNAANIFINARDININGASSNIGSNIYPGGIGKGGNIQVDTGTLILTNGGQITSNVLGQGNAGNIIITARNSINLDSIEEDATSGIQTLLLSGAGKGGDIQITTGSLTAKNGAEINTGTADQGNAGNININASGTVTIAGSKIRDGQSLNTSFSTNAGNNSVGKSGDIRLTAQSLFLQDGGLLTANSFGQGNAGNITINTIEKVVADGAVINGPGSGISTFATGGNGGDIEITTGTFSLTNGGNLFSYVIRRAEPIQANAGNIVVNARDAVIVDGIDNNGRASTISSDIIGKTTGKAGDIRITTKSFSLSNGGFLDSSTAAQGNAGNIIIDASDNITLNDTNVANKSSITGIYSAVANSGVGKGGDIRLTTRSLSTTNGAQISTTTAGQGDGGNIFLNASDSITFRGINSQGRFSGAYSAVDSGGIGKGGDINIATPSLFINDRALLNSGSFGTGNAGNININSRTVRLDNKSNVTAVTNFSDGGNIKLAANNYLLLRRGSSISTTAGLAQAGGNGGNIFIDTPFLIAVSSENSNITANAFTGNGGQVNIKVQSILGIKPIEQQLPQTSYISASSQFGVQGQVNITQPEVQPTQQQIELPGEILDASNQIGQICPRGANASKRQLGEFTVTGRGSLPPSLLEALPGKSSMLPLATLDTNTSKSVPVSSSQVSETPIIEAQGLVKMNDGSFELVAVAPTITPLKMQVGFNHACLQQ